MNPTLTTFLVIWGAALSTITFVWNLWRWRQEFPKIHVQIEAHEPPLSESGRLEWITFELRNRGGNATTVEEIMLVKPYDGWRGIFWGWFREFEIVEYESCAAKKTVQLPAVLKPYEVWKGSADICERAFGIDGSKDSLIRCGQLHYRIRCAHTNRLLSGKVRLAGNGIAI